MREGLRRWRERWQHYRAGAWALLAAGLVLAGGNWLAPSPASVAVTGTALPAGSRLGPGDVVATSCRTLLRQGRLLTAAQAAGRYAGRNLPAGTVLQPRLVRTRAGNGELAVPLSLPAGWGLKAGDRVLVVALAAAAHASRPLWQSPPLRVLGVSRPTLGTGSGRVVVAMTARQALRVAQTKAAGGRVEVLGWKH